MLNLYWVTNGEEVNGNPVGILVTALTEMDAINRARENFKIYYGELTRSKWDRLHIKCLMNKDSTTPWISGPFSMARLNLKGF